MPTAEEMMPSPADTRPQISVLVADLRRIASLVATGTQVGTWDGTGTPGWVGEAADAHMASISKLRSKLSPLVNGVQNAADEAARWAEALGAVLDNRIPELHEEWNHVQRVVEEEQRKAAEVPCSPDGHPVPSAPSRTGEMDPWAHARRQELLEDYKKVIDELNVAAQDAAKAVKVARSLFLPDEVGTSRNEIGLHMFEDEDSILEAQNRWERGEEIAKEIEQRFDQGFDNSTELQEFLDEYGDDLEDPFVATALGKEMTPDQLTSGVLQNLRHIHDPELCKELVSKMGTFQVLAGGGTNLSPRYAENQELLLQFEDALPETRVGDLSAHEAFATKMFEAGRKEIAVPWAPHTKMKGTELIAQLVGQAGLDNPHLALGEPVLRVEDEKDSFVKELLRHDSWRLRNYDGTERRLIFPWLDPKLEDPVFGLTTLMDQPEGAATHDSEAVRRHEANRMAGLKRFLASEIMGVDTNGDGVIDGADRKINITEYIMGGRTVNEREIILDGSFQSYSGFPDGGVQFTTVVAEASRPESDELFDVMSKEEREAWRERDEHAVRIAKGYLLGYQNGLDVYRPEGRHEIEGQLPFGYENRAARSLAADVIGPHLKGVSRSMETPVGAGQDLFQEDEGSKRYLIALEGDDVNRLRGTEGVFADLAFDGASEYGKAAEDMARGRIPSIQQPSAVDKLLAWAATGYQKDLDASFAAAPVPLADDPRSRITEASKDWTHITHTLFTAPQGASALQMQAVSEQNEMWRQRMETGVVLTKAAAGMLKYPGVEAVAEITDHFLVQPALADAFPTGFKAQDVTRSGRETTEEFMKGILMATAAEEVDFSQARIPLSKLYDSARGEIKVVDEKGTLLPFDSMSPNSRGRFFDYLTRELADWEFQYAVDAVSDEVTAANQERQYVVSHEDARRAGGLGAQELEEEEEE
ncbi:MAG: hypothetical protein Q4D89_09085 [Arachnia propionica]|uniref:hypothetical protein n=1 Tax=Arachnia propionica TaxID=1750 RepID=UPI00270DD035|nr:hypothetical protein [Arachnia propionica]